MTGSGSHNCQPRNGRAEYCIQANSEIELGPRETMLSRTAILDDERRRVTDGAGSFIFRPGRGNGCA